METSLVQLSDIDQKKGTLGAWNQYASRATRDLARAWKVYKMIDASGEFSLRDTVHTIMDDFAFDINIAAMIAPDAVRRLKKNVDERLELVLLKLETLEDPNLVILSVALMDEQRILEAVCTRNPEQETDNMIQTTMQGIVDNVTAKG